MTWVISFEFRIRCDKSYPSAPGHVTALTNHARSTLCSSTGSLPVFQCLIIAHSMTESLTYKGGRICNGPAGAFKIQRFSWRRTSPK